MALISEAEWESTALEVLTEQGWLPTTGAELAHERTSRSDLVLTERVHEAVRPLNPAVPAVCLRQAVTEILSPASQDAISENRRFHEFLAHGCPGRRLRNGSASALTGGLGSATPPSTKRYAKRHACFGSRRSQVRVLSPRSVSPRPLSPTLSPRQSEPAWSVRS